MKKRIIDMGHRFSAGTSKAQARAELLDFVARAAQTGVTSTRLLNAIWDGKLVNDKPFKLVVRLGKRRALLTMRMGASVVHSQFSGDDYTVYWLY